ncbi:MAG: hypothetical protein ACOX9E_02150 [Lentisphaeria bacterium]|jgi:type I restriction enzyme S subunit
MNQIDHKEIADTLAALQHAINLLKQLADNYKTQKRGLMQKMPTDEWRIKPEIICWHSGRGITP